MRSDLLFQGFSAWLKFLQLQNLIKNNISC
uniref:Uncharacterized protein n=1 Tax=Arundo donax TaxID=35708 RepID=A0A0A9FNW4_ARUDO